MLHLRETLSFDQAKMVVEHTENESGGKDLYLKGICIQGGVRNANQRVYPVTEIGRAVNTLNDQIKGGYSVLGEVDHPEGLNINLDRVSHMITEMWMDGPNGYGKLKVIPTPMGQIIDTMIKSNVKIGVSSRGSGNVKEDGSGEVSEFEIITVDCVAQPSAPGAYPTPIYEHLLNNKGGYKAMNMARELHGDEKAQIAAIELITKTLGDDYDVRRTEFVGPTVGAELAEKGILAVICSLVAIMVYIWFRFEWQFSIAAILALAHDVLTTIGLFALTSFEFNLATVAAILTIAGYSINDTVVVFDRVRENLRRYKSYEQPAILNMSLNETLSRTVMTSVTTMLALLAIVLFGGAVLRDFALAMMWGVLIGTYSSIFVAVGMLAFFDLKKNLDEDEDPGVMREEG